MPSEHTKRSRRITSDEFFDSVEEQDRLIDKALVLGFTAHVHNDGRHWRFVNDEWAFALFPTNHRMTLLPIGEAESKRGVLAKRGTYLHPHAASTHATAHEFVDEVLWTLHRINEKHQNELRLLLPRSIYEKEFPEDRLFTANKES